MLTQVRDSFDPADWHLGDHGPMPDIVAHGKKPDVIGRALCHYPNGKGRPENAGISDLPVVYFIGPLPRQLHVRCCFSVTPQRNTAARKTALSTSDSPQG
jgi:hypothetical protein